VESEYVAEHLAQGSDRRGTTSGGDMRGGTTSCQYMDFHTQENCLGVLARTSLSQTHTHTMTTSHIALFKLLHPGHPGSLLPVCSSQPPPSQRTLCECEEGGGAWQDNRVLMMHGNALSVSIFFIQHFVHSAFCSFSILFIQHFVLTFADSQGTRCELITL